MTSLQIVKLVPKSMSGEPLATEEFVVTSIKIKIHPQFNVKAIYVKTTSKTELRNFAILCPVNNNLKFTTEKRRVLLRTHNFEVTEIPVILITRSFTKLKYHIDIPVFYWDLLPPFIVEPFRYIGDEIKNIY